MIPDEFDSCKTIDLPAGLSGERAEFYRAGYAAGHAAGYVARAQHDLVDLLEVADGTDAESRHATVHRISDRGRAA